MSTPAPEIEIDELNNLFLFQETEMEPIIRQYMDSYEAPFWAKRAITDFNFTLGQGYIKNVWTGHGAPAPQQPRLDLWTKIRKSGLDGGYKPRSDHSGADNCPPGTYDADLNSCVPDPKARIRWGFERKEYEPYISWLDTDSFCLKDLQHDWQIEQQVAHILRNLRDAISGHAENWNRDTYAAFCKILPCVPNFWAHEPDELGLFPDVGLNPFLLTQRPLDQLHEVLAHEYRDKAIGTNRGMPVFGLITSERDTEAIFKSEPEFRTDMRYTQDPRLMERMGSDVLFRNFLHMWDPHLPRFVPDASEPGGLRRVYRWAESSTTKGYKNTTNMEYINAPYGLAMVYMEDVFSNGKIMYKNSVGGMGGEGVTMLREAELHWVNFRERGNELGQIGKYLIEFTRAPRPGVKPGFCFLHRRADFQNEFRSSTAACPPTVDSCGTALTGNVVSAVQTSATVLTITLTGAISGVGVNDRVKVFFADGYWLEGEVNTAPSGVTLVVTLNTIADPVEVAIVDHQSVFGVQAV